MNTLEGLWQGFQVAFSLEGIFFVFIGVTIGTLIGMLPGLGPITAIAIMIPMVYGMDPTIAMVLMAGVYYGAVFGGSTSSILLNAPGVSGTVATSFDGYPMAQQGKAGKALAIAAIASFTGGTVSIILLMLFAPTLAQVAVSFGPVEYFALMFMGLVAISSLSDGSAIKALISGVLGFMAVTIGIDAQTGTPRFTFGNSNLLEGVDFLVVALGLFALAEVAFLIKNRNNIGVDKTQNIGSLKLTKQDFKEMTGPLLRHSPLGFILGVLPGAGATIASFISYMTEKRFSKKPEEFGKGSVKGLTAPETSNNAATSGAFVPLLSLGIPGSGTTAIMLGALLVLGINPGPLLFQDHPEVFWGVVASMYVGNVFLLVLNLPLIPYIAKILKIPRPLLISLIIMFCMIGVYSISFNIFDLYLLLAFGLVGYLFRLFAFPAPPFILAFILGGMMEQSLRQVLTISNGDFMILVESPIAIGLFILSFLSFAFPFIKTRKIQKV
ncbi:tripartite tricarboxylate transporter permease [Virgibacillus pantothenticus]|uniref:tripartite tricarboxylate transporter permease n=1 Tax=Virgibacillus pantothenticus TaxID=1473 RepID=UPI001C20FB2E|nr:tripartite tricarboxylate transporter permease [Virgibacillus pantothenticus]MBU8565735.1 tripartite tricarboxylate transporter permease [Virgibacillus pantothenticus]MBU8599678.1 tripartite tricarboxylate transporter permease [Virgibacillus pantothenticus]MBU8634125.1 tripartite tricarboxylate transporter permease [Virgibacillus pantothenticus]MBU8642166.1 tripartite tricarboxylate transporter permease [Virgibacillus pantothenticus]MBU8645851.1 tripartite tricarboxylate transporter permeas